MGVVRWNIKASAIDDFDRSKQYTPYTGPIPPDAVYVFLIKKMQYVPGTRDKLDQLRVGMELVPRKGMGEGKYKGYFVMNFIPVADNTGFRYVPLCDALGVSGTDFTERMRVDREGNVQRIGQWRNTGEQEILAQIVTGYDEKGEPRKEVKWMGPLQEPDEDDEEYDSDDEEYAEDGDEDEDYDDYEVPF